MFNTYLGLKNRFSRFISEDKGATAIEYGLIAAGIAVVIIAIVFSIGTELQNMFTDVQTNLQARPQ
ncbi:MAG: Flp family type IVb pilin [Alphaproteobacteria bacterium]|nr:Flp family type IVb pilin [Alphaproteobacteria bacterium]